MSIIAAASPASRRQGVVPRAERACTRPFGFQLSVRRGRLIWAGIAQDPKAPLLVGHVDITVWVTRSRGKGPARSLGCGGMNQPLSVGSNGSLMS